MPKDNLIQSQINKCRNTIKNSNYISGNLTICSDGSGLANTAEKQNI